MIFLVRHGKTAYNAEWRLQGQRDIPLCYEGLLQAEELGQRLKKQGPRFGALYCSTLSRARVTAEIIGRHLGLAPVAADGLQEIALGKFEGFTFAEAERVFPREFADFSGDRAHSSAHGGETPGQVFLRARAALLSLPEVKAALKGEPAPNALIVSHGAVISFLRAAACGRALVGCSDLIPGNAELIPFEREELLNIARYEL